MWLTLFVLLCAAFVCASPLPSGAAELSDVPYVDFTGASASCASATEVQSGDQVWNTGWYVVSGDVALVNRIDVSGNVNLILADGCTLTASQGIEVSGEGNSLTIYGQTSGTGLLYAVGDLLNAGIGGTLAPCAPITINGGTIEASATDGAGIGGGYNAGGDSISTITINGGTIRAQGGREGAGIGTGSSSPDDPAACKIVVTGGTITATGGERGAGIGAGQTGSCDITISGGVIEARGGFDAAGIGTGRTVGEAYLLLCKVSITGGWVAAVGGDDSGGRGWGAAIGYGGGYQYVTQPDYDGKEIDDSAWSNCVVFRQSQLTSTPGVMTG